MKDFLRHLKIVERLALAALLRRQAETRRPVACIIGNQFLLWVTDVAVDASIPSAVR
jgi:hypothetical protein